MNTARASQKSVDTLSLEGLEALLDQVFSAEPETPRVVPVKRTADSEEKLSVKSTTLAEIISSSDKVMDTANTERAIQLLEAQLSYMKGELQRYAYSTRFLQAQIALKDDQIKLIPELMKRCNQASVVEKKLSLVQDHCRDLQKEIAGLRDELHRAKAPFWQKLNSWLTGSPLDNYSS